MLELAGPGDEAYSCLPNLADGEPVDPSQWSWHTWVEQEKRLRTTYPVFLLDAALNIWYNCPTQFDPWDIKDPLTCDDAGWKAIQPDDCTHALGLHGSETQTAVNTTGSLRPKPIATDHLMDTLYVTSYIVQPRTTNVYSQFILVHART